MIRRRCSVGVLVPGVILLLPWLSPPQEAANLEAEETPSVEATCFEDIRSAVASCRETNTHLFESAREILEEIVAKGLLEEARDHARKISNRMALHSRACIDEVLRTVETCSETLDKDEADALDRALEEAIEEIEEMTAAFEVELKRCTQPYR